LISASLKNLRGRSVTDFPGHFKGLLM